MDVCQKCGDKGDVKKLVHCACCEGSVEHSYCLDILPKRSEKQILWTCEDCVEKEKKLILVGSRKSERIWQAVDVKLSRKQQKKPINSTKKKTPFYIESIPESNASSGNGLLFNKDSNQQPASQLVSAVRNEPLIPEAKTSRGDCLLFDVDSNQQAPSDAVIDNKEFRRPKRRLLLEDEEISDQELEPVETEASQLVSTVIPDALFPEADTSRGDCLLFNEDPIQQPAANAIIDNNDMIRPKRRLLLEEEISDQGLEPVETEASQLVSAVIHVTLIPEANASRGDCQLFNEDPIRQPAADAIIDNKDMIREKRRLLLEEGEISDQELEPVETEVSQLVFAVTHHDLLIKSSSLHFLESLRCVDFQPPNDPIWRGQFIINNVKFQTSFELVSHLMKEDCTKARNTVNLLPQLLSIEMLSKFDVWNERFQISDDSIFLFFFPVYESDEKVFDSLLEDMMHHNLALKAMTKQAQLQVFSSTELPLTHYWRICSKYYMWGVLQPTNHAG